MPAPSPSTTSSDPGRSSASQGLLPGSLQRRSCELLGMSVGRSVGRSVEHVGRCSACLGQVGQSVEHVGRCSACLDQACQLAWSVELGSASRSQLLASSPELVGSTLGTARDGTSTGQTPREGRASGEDGDRGDLVGGSSCGSTPWVCGTTPGVCASASEGYGGNCGNAPPAWGQPPEAQPRTAEHGAELQLGDPVHVGAGSVAGSTAAETQPPKRT